MHLHLDIPLSVTTGTLNHWTMGLWLLIGAVWLGFAPLAKRAVYRQPPWQRLSHIVPFCLGVYLLFGNSPAPAVIDWIDLPLLAITFPLALAGFFLVLGGIAFSIWARLTLDGNWSGIATLKQDHTLTRTGPYRITRHPIYSGLLLALAGSALERGLVRSLLAIVICALGLWLKIAVEEKLMVHGFGEQYLQYRREVPALIPLRF
jgi:protein-S-isoprenylcysteine O-methyltransferase Ste14